MATSTTTATEDRALTLLGQGVPPTAVANALGVDISRISQLLSQDDFAAKVVERKFESLAKNNERDDKIDDLEDKLLKKLHDCLPFMTRPMEVLKAFTVLNAAKRRGASSPEDLTSKQQIVQLNIPSIIVNRFQTNIHNQVVQVGEKSLITIPSNQMVKKFGAQDAPLTLTDQTNDATTIGQQAETVSTQQGRSS